MPRRNRYYSRAKALGDKAIGIHLFPSVTKADFILGAQGGDGALFEKGNYRALQYRRAVGRLAGRLSVKSS
jgi:lipid-binding SYLF domain-containing protein